MSYAPHRLGRAGERLAQAYLVRRGYTVLDRNYRAGRREVDLIVEQGGVLVFVEVKTRSSRRWGGAVHAVGPRKRREVEAVARRYLLEHPHPRAGVRFDVVAVDGDPCAGDPVVFHVQDAWRPERP